MTPHVLIRNTIIKKNIEDVFEFFSKAENLNRITPPVLGFRIITKLPLEMKKGTLIDYKIKLNGIPFNWRTEITEWKPPFYFEDTQIKGPYKIWIHEHKFERTGNDTRMTDIINYLSPGGILEFIPHNLVVRKKVESIFDYREKVLKKIFSE
ncbi:MAG: SRPBCC family protein [Ignavibacteria bacterium]|nr:SRPBCC family protein [Ignavibacteria bacterium]